MAIVKKENNITLLEKEVRIDQFYLWLKKNSVFLLVLGICILGFVGLCAWDENKSRKTRIHDSETYEDALALLKKNKKHEALSLLDTTNKDNIYGVFSAIKRGNILMEEGKKEEAYRVFGKLSSYAAPDCTFMDLFEILALYASEGKPESDISYIAHSGHIFRFFALEMEALSLLKAKKKKEAAVLFSELAQDEDFPLHIKGRARGWLESFSSEQKDN